MRIANKHPFGLWAAAKRAVKLKELNRIKGAIKLAATITDAASTAAAAVGVPTSRKLYSSCIQPTSSNSVFIGLRLVTVDVVVVVASFGWNDQKHQKFTSHNNISGLVKHEKCLNPPNFKQAFPSQTKHLTSSTKYLP